MSIWKINSEFSMHTAVRNTKRWKVKEVSHNATRIIKRATAKLREVLNAYLASEGCNIHTLTT